MKINYQKPFIVCALLLSTLLINSCNKENETEIINNKPGAPNLKTSNVSIDGKEYQIITKQNGEVVKDLPVNVQDKFNSLLESEETINFITKDSKGNQITKYYKNKKEFEKENPKLTTLNNNVKIKPTAEKVPFIKFKPKSSSPNTHYSMALRNFTYPGLYAGRSWSGNSNNFYNGSPLIKIFNNNVSTVTVSNYHTTENYTQVILFEGHDRSGYTKSYIANPGLSTMDLTKEVIFKKRRCKICAKYDYYYWSDYVSAFIFYIFPAG